MGLALTSAGLVTVCVSGDHLLDSGSVNTTQTVDNTDHSLCLGTGTLSEVRRSNILSIKTMQLSETEIIRLH